MARVTVEDCLEKVDNRFMLATVAVPRQATAARRPSPRGNREQGSRHEPARDRRGSWSRRFRKSPKASESQPAGRDGDAAPGVGRGR